MHFTCNLNTNPTNPFSENLIYKQPHLNLISHLLAPKHKPYQLISATAPPQITPTGLVFWQGRVKLRSDLTLSNVPPHWQPLRGGLSKTDASWGGAEKETKANAESNHLVRYALVFHRTTNKLKPTKIRAEPLRSRAYTFFIVSASTFYHERKPLLSW